MKKQLWLVIVGIILICAAIGFTVLGVYRIIYIIKTDPFEDTPKYVLKVFGLVGIIFLQIFMYGGGIGLIIIGCILAGKADKKETKRVVEAPVVNEINDAQEDPRIRYEDVKTQDSKLLIKDEEIEMSSISNISMKGNEARFNVDLKEYVILCPGSAQAVQLVSKIKQYSK